MLQVHIDSPISLTLEDVLEGIANLEMGELEELTDKVIGLRAERRIPSIPQDEADLLEKINRGLSADARRRYGQLLQKLLDESMSTEEHEEYLSLIGQIKLADAKRMHCLVELAALRNRSVDADESRGIDQPAGSVVSNRQTSAKVSVNL